MGFQWDTRDFPISSYIIWLGYIPLLDLTVIYPLVNIQKAMDNDNP